MKPITTDELAAIGREATNACDLPCQIQRAAGRTPEPDGGTTTTPTIVATTKVGLRQPTASQLQNFGYLVGTKATWLAVFALGTDVLELDVILTAGQKLQVAKLLNPNSFSTLLTVIANEVK